MTSNALQFGEIRHVQEQIDLQLVEVSSYGTPRAADLRLHRMVGYGWVFERLVAGEVRDDELAVIHDAEPPYQQRTIPLVDVWYYLEVADLSEESRAAASTLLAALRNLPLRDRIWPVMIRSQTSSCADDPTGRRQESHRFGSPRQR